MNSNYGKPNSSSGSLGSFDFDLGLNSGRSRPLNDQKSNSNTASYMNTSSQSRVNTSGGPNRPAWTHQPAAPAAQPGWGASLAGPTSMVGDIFGKSWGSTGGVNAAPPPVAAASSIGMAKKDPNLFGDLVNSALGQNKGGIGGGNAPLKNANPTGNKNAFSVGGMADSLPKTGATGGSWGSNDAFGSFTSAHSGNKASGTSNVNLSGGAIKDPKLGSGIGIGMKTNQDPFDNLVNLSAKPSGGMNIGSKANNTSSPTNDSFAEFQNAGKASGSAFPSSATSNNSSSMGSSTSGGYSKMDDFGTFNTSSQAPVQPSGNDFDALFAPSKAPNGGTAKGNEGFDTQQFEGGDDWGFHGSDDTSGTTELEGLPPPPAGVSGSMAKTKGMDNYKGGQFADAIKWLSWAVVLLEKAGDDAGTMDVLSSRASCYKEVGEYKKAVADCSKILEHNGNNVDVLVQRALLYESMEKYKLGAEDLRKVMNLDPSNRVARSTIHRLTKMAASC